MNKFAPLFLIIAIALGALAAHEYNQAEHLRAIVMQMKKDAAAGREESDSQAAEVRTLKERTRTQKVAIVQLEARNKELADAGPSAAPAPAESGDSKIGEGGFMKGIANVFSDPKMKEAVRGQQAAGITMMYGDLAKHLGLSSDEARQVLALLTDRQVEEMSKSMALLKNGNLDIDALAEAGKQGDSARAGYDKALKEVLGEERYAKFEEYEKSIGERFALDQVRNQLAAGGLPLNEAQSANLLTIMKEERARTPKQSTPERNDVAAQMKLLENGELMEGMLKDQEAYSQRVVERARSLLSPDQLQVFEAAQKQQIEMQRMGAQMGREMFKKGK